MRRVDLGRESIVDVVCGDASVMVLCESGKVYGWGQGYCEEEVLDKQILNTSLSDYE